MQRRPWIVVRPPLPPFSAHLFDHWHNRRDFSEDNLQRDELFWRCLTDRVGIRDVVGLLWKEAALVSLRCGVDRLEATEPLTHGRLELRAEQPGRPPPGDFNPHLQRPHIEMTFRCYPHTGSENAREHALSRLRRGDLVVLRTASDRADIATSRTTIFPQARITFHDNGEIRLLSFVCSKFFSWNRRKVRERYEQVKKRIERMKNLSLDMYEVFSAQPYRTMLDAMQRLSESPDVLTPPRGFEEPEILWLADVFGKQPFNGFHLNKSEADVVARICLHSKPWPLLVHGPIKTGKLLVLVISGLIFVRKGDVTLITTSTNKAADRIARELLRSSRKNDRSKILRFFAPSTCFFTRDVELDAISNVLPEKEFGPLSWFSDKKLVICTMDSAAHFIGENWEFDRILLTEAPMAKPGELPLVLSLATKQTKVVMFGDHKLLNPHQLPLHIHEVERNYRSLFTRYAEMRAYENSPQMRPLLRTSYRSHSLLITTIGKLFYGGHLEIGFLGTDAPTLSWSKMPNKEFPIVFISVDGKEHEDKNFSWSNLEEQIDEALKGMGIGDAKIIVDSVERFLGLSKKVIVFTTARTNELGFLNDGRRLNTAMSRATDLLIIIGHGRALYENYAYKKLLKICMANRAVVRWDPDREDFDDPIRTEQELDAAHPEFAEILRRR
ncbi:RNA helicase [Aphelenchoides fujianensis]|nr:RNA helicase [Aphelenchoides fujianensis]